MIKQWIDSAASSHWGGAVYLEDAGGTGTADALRAACEAALPRPKRPAAFHLVGELPLGPTGKVARGRLRQLAAAHLDPVPGAAA